MKQHITSSLSLDLLSSKMICKGSSCEHSYTVTCCMLGQKRGNGGHTRSFVTSFAGASASSVEDSGLDGTRSDCIPKKTSRSINPTTNGREIPWPPFTGMNMARGV
ncbi:TPA: hypothetical protein ACH3X3_013650 [Trebouxia sp. C0006]